LHAPLAAETNCTQEIWAVGVRWHTMHQL